MTDVSQYWNSGNTTPSASSNVSGPETEMHYAGFLERFLAYGIDHILMAVYGLVILKLVNFFNPLGASVTSSEWGELVFLLVTSIYFIFFTAIWGMTPGKKLFGLKVLKNDFTKISLRRTILREVVGRIAAGAVLLSYLAIIFSGRKRGLQDLIGGTVVVRKSPRTARQRIAYLLLTCLLIFLPFIGVTLIALLGNINPLSPKPVPITGQTDNITFTATPTLEPLPTSDMYRNLTPVPQPTYMPTPSVGPTDGWNKFINTKYLYSIKYPPGALYTSGTPVDNPDVFTSPNVLFSDLTHTSSWEIEVDMGLKKSADVSLVDFARKDIDSTNSYIRPDVPKFAILYTTVIDGHNAVFYGNNSPDNHDLKLQALIERNPTDLVSIISVPTGAENQIDYREFFYQIVSTLSFNF